MAKRKTLWAETQYKDYVIPIYKVSGVLPGFDAWTEHLPDKSVEVCIQASVFKSPRRFDEVLVHEFIHVIEYIVGVNNLGHRHSKTNLSCTKSAKVLGEALPIMFRSIKQAKK